MRQARETSALWSAGFEWAITQHAPVPANDNDPFDPPPPASLRAPRPQPMILLNYTLAEAA